MRKSTFYKSIFSFLLLFTSIKPVFAANFQISGAMNQAVTIMSSLFYPSVLMNDPTVQVGFFKFMFFLLIFTILNWALASFVFKKGLDEATNKRASAVAAFAIAAISALFMPVELALTTGGLISGLFTLLIPLAITGIILYFAFGKFNKGMQNLIGLGLIIFNIILLQWMLGVIA